VSQPKRFDVGMREETCPTMGISRWPWVYPCEQGEYVLYTDYAALAAEKENEVAELQAKVADIEARCRLLRRLGDEMAEALDDGEPNLLIDKWYDAKQGM
jgi:hypothetical protein